MICVECGEEQEYESICIHCGEQPLLNQRYALLSILGQGVEGVTYRSLDTQAQSEVVIKERLWKPGHQSKRKERLEREAQVLSEIKHPQIPQYYEHFLQKEGRRTSLYIVQEYVKGEVLFSLMKRKRFIKDEIWDLAEQILDILVYLQDLSPPIIHRDIKPSNVMFQEEERKYFLIDFGSVRDALSDPEMGSSTYAGTFGYMPPEQVYGQSDCRTDLYSLGAMLIELLTRQPPVELLQYDQSFAWLKHVSLSKPYIQFIQKLCETNPEQRFLHARQARSILRSIRTAPENPVKKIIKEPALPSLDDFRTMIREELSSSVPKKIEDTNIHAEKNSEPKTSPIPKQADPLLPTSFEHRLLPRKRGWWSPKPPRKLEEPLEPLHPAVQLSLMAAAVFGSSILMQFVLF